MKTNFRGAAVAMALTLMMSGATARAQDTNPIATPANMAWWTAWSSCDITPVHTERRQGNDPAIIEFLPWLEAETTNDSNATVIVSLFSNNRPLPVGGAYDDGSNPKWLWILSDDLKDLTITATNENGTMVEFHDLGSTNGNQWPSNIDVPEPGCWTFDITATSLDGSVYEGRIVFPAVP